MSMTVKQHTDSWSKSAHESMISVGVLLKNKRKIEALFFGHLAIEKILKSMLAAKRLPIPRGRQGHDLVFLANTVGLQLTPDERNELNTITSFNIEARYAIYKQNLYQQCTPQYLNQWITCIRKWYKFIKQLVSQERTTLPNNTQM